MPPVLLCAVGRSPVACPPIERAVAGTGGDGSLFSALAAIDGCHQETKLLEEIIGQMEGHMAQLGEATRFIEGSAFTRGCSNQSLTLTTAPQKKNYYKSK